jgi:hypothetical protein
MPEIWQRLTRRAKLAIFKPAQMNWLLQWIGWEILLGQKGSKTSLGQKFLRMRHNFVLIPWPIIVISTPAFDLFWT